MSSPNQSSKPRGVGAPQMPLILFRSAGALILLGALIPSSFWIACGIAVVMLVITTIHERWRGRPFGLTRETVSSDEPVKGNGCASALVIAAPPNHDSDHPCRVVSTARLEGEAGAERAICRRRPDSSIRFHRRQLALRLLRACVFEHDKISRHTKLRSCL